jgi:hypothetical protein
MSSGQMNLLILNGPRDPRAAKYPSYRGTYRAHPTYCDALPNDHEINQLFFWFLEDGGELGLVHDLAKASRYVELLNQNPLPGYKQFEIVEVTSPDSPQQAGGRLLGFDLSAGYNSSLLWWGLEPQLEPNAVREPIGELVDLAYRYYAPRLGPCGLFQTPEIASQCLRSMDALQRLSPNLYEGEDLIPSYRVVGVYLVRPGGG